MVSTKLRIKELLRERRWTTKVLAEKTGLSESYLTHIKNGTRRWNADSLTKIATAFEIDPTEMFLEIKKPTVAENVVNVGFDKNAIEVSVVPVVGKIPAHPSFTNNRTLQAQTGSNNFVPLMGIKDESMFAIKLEDNSLEPLFHKGDYLIISPEAWTSSGDIAAIEYGNDENNRIQVIKKISFTDDLVLLDSTNSSTSPIAIVRGKDHFRIIGKVVLRYQTL